MSIELSYWEKTAFFNYDVIIIGSGIVGLSTAIHIKKHQPKLRIAILDMGFMPSGASTKNAGFACFGSISELIEQEKYCGADGLAEMVEKRWQGLNKLRSLLGDNTIDYKCLGGYELFKPNEHLLAQQCVSKIEHYNYLTRNIIGFDTFKLANEKINRFGFNGIDTLIESKYEAQIDPGKMMFALVQLAQQMCITFFNNCKVNEIDNQPEYIALQTNAGVFRCKKLAVATNAFITSLFPNLAVKPGRGQVIITKPIIKLKINGTFHYDKGFYYFRNINDRVLIGGGRNLDFNTETTTQFGQTEIVQQALETLLREVVLPDLDFEIDQRWSGIMAFGEPLQPLIEEIKPNIFCATRCNGMGIAIGAQTGEDLGALILKKL